MRKILDVINSLNRFSDEEKKLFNSLIQEKSEEFNKDALGCVTEVLKEMIWRKEAELLKKDDFTNPKVIERLNRQKDGQLLFCDTNYVNWMFVYTLSPLINENNMYQLFHKSNDSVNQHFFSKLEGFYDALYDYSVHIAKTKKICYYHENVDRAYFNLSYGQTVFRIYAHPNSPLGITFCRVENLNGETVISFDDIRTYYQELNNVNGGTQRVHKDE